MAAPSYTEDLTDIDLAESGSTGWTAFNISGGGGGAPAFGADLGMQGLGCWDKPCSNAERGLAVNKTPGAGTTTAGVHIFTWGFCATPGITDNLAIRGAYVLIGTSTSNFMQFHVEGKDTYGAAGRVGKCYVVDYHTTANTGSVPYSTSNGTPGATPTYFGFGLKTTATAKGSNIGCDAVRYGTGAYITAGDATDPATFLGFQTQNDSINNRWGILTDVGGSFELQGRFVVGQNNATTPTAAHFDDSSGVSILLVDTVHSATDFTQIIIDHASTVFNLSGATIKALGTNNPGRLVFNNASTVAALDGNVFENIGITTLRDAVVCTGNTWKACDQITQNGATITDGIIRDSSASSALLIDTALEAADVTGVSFVDNNTGGTPVLDTTPYFDGSDAAATDAGTDWTNATNADDGSTATAATVSVANSSVLSIEGTDYTSATDDGLITQVEFRVYAHGNGGIIDSTLEIEVYEDGGTTLLGSGTISNTVAGWTSYLTLTEPSGGWTAAKIQALEIDVFSGTGGSIPGGSFYMAELRVTESAGHSIELTATGSHDFTDVTFSGGGGAPGTNSIASSGSAIADVYNNSGGAITINVTGGGSPSVRNAASSTTTVVATVPITITVKDTDGNLLSGIAVGVYLTSDRTEVLLETTTGTGIASGTLDSSLTPAEVEVRCRKGSSADSPRYKNFSTVQTVASSTGLTLAVTMVEDTNNNATS